EHLDTIPEKESDEFIKSSVENLVPNQSEFEDLSNIRRHSEEIYSNPLFDKEIISIKIDPHHFGAESDLIESLLNQDSSIISSSKIDSLLDEFAGELIFLKSIPPRIDEADFESFSPSLIPVEASDRLMEEIDLFLTSDGSIPSGIDSDYSTPKGIIFSKKIAAR
nr:hypothetical protein [Tanacetum cinerariifolium]